MALLLRQGKVAVINFYPSRADSSGHFIYVHHSQIKPQTVIALLTGIVKKLQPTAGL